MPIRVILQGISQASLLVDNEEKYVHCGRGVLIYVAFLKPQRGANEKGADGERDEQADSITDEDVAQAVSTLLETCIFTHFSPERMVARPQSLKEAPDMDVMVVPQASLGGKINKKGHSVQFHHLVAKDMGAALYERFCHHLRVARGVVVEDVDINGVPLRSGSDENFTTQGPKGDRWIKYAGRVLCGTFGNRQALSMESDGPFTHTFDL